MACGSAVAHVLQQVPSAAVKSTWQTDCWLVCLPSPGGRGAGRAAATTDEGSSSGSRTPLLGEGLLGVFDLKQNMWLQPQVTGQGPSPRSGARAVSLSDRIVIYGGAAQGGLCERCLETSDTVRTHVLVAMGLQLWVPACVRKHCCHFHVEDEAAARARALPTCCVVSNVSQAPKTPNSSA
jgi:hypothetical protein